MFMKKAEGDRVNSIDVLRIIAIFLVILFHILYQLSCFNKDGCNNLLRPIGFVGISLFFIISGYLLAKKYPTLENFSLKWFFKRYIKIASLYYISLISITILFLNQVYYGSPIKHLVVHFLFLEYFFPNYSYSIISPAWFLFPLMIFYLSYPYLNKLIKKNLIFVLIVFILMNIVRFADGNYTSLSPLFFLGEFCFGIAFYHGEKNRSLLISTLTIFNKPIMFISYPIFYLFINTNLDRYNLKYINLLGKYTLFLFLFHEAYIKVILNIWHIYNLNLFIELLILIIISLGSLYLSKKAENYIIEKLDKFKFSGI
jgi:peptidoglycan/LPS O-acetylase OafA/YrhL